MDEIKFVVKSLLAALALTLLMQIQVGNESLETKAEFWIHTSSVPQYLQGVATGAVKALKTAKKSATDLVNANMGGNKSAITTRHTQE